MQRRPAILLVVCGLHLVLAAVLLSAGTGRSSTDRSRHPAPVAVTLLTAATPAPPPTTPAPAAPRTRTAPRIAPLPPVTEVSVPPAALAHLPDPAVLQLPARSSGDADRTFHEPPAPATAAIPTTRTAAPIEAPAATTPRAEPSPLVSAHADRRLCPPAPHPAALRERGIEGAVLLRVLVDAQGRPADVQVASGSGWRLFDEAALQQVRACRFVPATRGGQAVDSWVEFPVRFALAG